MAGSEVYTYRRVREGKFFNKNGNKMIIITVYFRLIRTVMDTVISPITIMD